MTLTASTRTQRTRREGLPAIRENSVVNSYSKLLKTVRDEGLLKKRPGFYITVSVLLFAAIAAAGTGFVLLGESWFQLLIAAALGILLTQAAFIAHEASHRQVFESGPANDRAGRFLANAVVGISYQWWMNKHTRHHANPNTVGKDPDIDMDTISFQEEQAAGRRGFGAWFTRRQGWLFFPLLTLEGLNLHATSIKYLFTRHTDKGRFRELAVIALRLGLYLGAVFFFLPVGMAFAFIGVQLAVFGIYMGASFAPNHKGMPIIAKGVKVDFLSRQVLTSRNIVGRGMNTLLGGLNYQVEHHLFPSMPRPHLRRASQIVKAHCAEHDIKYTETTLMRSYGIVVRYLNRVGLAARDPFDCPAASAYGR